MDSRKGSLIKSNGFLVGVWRSSNPKNSSLETKALWEKQRWLCLAVKISNPRSVGRSKSSVLKGLSEQTSKICEKEKQAKITQALTGLENQLQRAAQAFDFTTFTLELAMETSRPLLPFGKLH